MGAPVNHDEDVPAKGADQAMQALGVLQSNKAKWATMAPADRLSYLERMLARLQALDHESWGRAAAEAQGFLPDHRVGDFHVAMESMVNVSVFVGTVKHLIRTVTAQAKTGQGPTLARAARGEREVVQVFPVDQDDKFSHEGRGGCTGEVWLRPGLAQDTERDAGGSVCLVLGAGNQSFLAFGDVMYHLFVEGVVCALKHHPLRVFSAPYFDEIFADLSADGFFFACVADLEQTQQMLHSPLVDRVHMTGGTASHDAIVWGEPGPVQQANKASREPVLRKPMSSELGAVTPWLVIPGAEWSTEELGHMAGHLVAAFTAQNSCNCLSPKIVVLDKDWPQATRFLQEVRNRLSQTPLLPPHYPGTAARYRAFQDAYPDEVQESICADTVEGMSDHQLGPCLPWLLINVDETSDPYAWTTEAFAPVLAIYEVSSRNDPDEFARKAVPFVNDSVWGSLSCTVLAHPDIDAELVEGVITDLRYGSIGLNAWTAATYGTSGMTWGAYPGEPLHAVASGRGVVRNAYGLSGVEKSVLRSPFMTSSQLVVHEDGRVSTTAIQIRAIRRVLLHPNIRAILALVREMATPRPPAARSLRQACVIWLIRAVEGVLGLPGLASRFR